MSHKNIFRRGSIWWVRYSHDGHQIRESSGSNVFADADRLLKKRNGEVVTGKFAGLAPERITIGELLADVEQDYRDNVRKSLRQLLSRLKRLRPAFENIRAADFSSDYVKRYRSRRLQAGASRAAINREIEILARAWSLAQKCDPPKVTRPFHFPMFEENNVRTGFLEDEQYQALHDALPAYLKPLLLVGYRVPCRIGELTNLLMTQLDFKGKEIVLNPGETKNRDGRRMPMFGPMRECLSMQKAIRDEKFPDCPYVFFGESGERIVDFRKAWKCACKRAGINEKTLFHDLRRSAARNMRRAGVPEHTIMKIAGWKTPSMFRRYDIQDGRDIQRAGETMETWIASQGPISTVSSTISEKAQSRNQSNVDGNRLN
jgi:integrase